MREKQRENERWQESVVLVMGTAFFTLLVIEESEGFEPRGAQGSQGACFMTAGTLILSIAQFLSGSVGMFRHKSHVKGMPPTHPTIS